LLGPERLQINYFLNGRMTSNLFLNEKEFLYIE